MNNGELEAQYTGYQSRLDKISSLTMVTFPDRLELCQQLSSFICDIENDLEILHTSQQSERFDNNLKIYSFFLSFLPALQQSQRKYEDKVSATIKVPEKILFNLAWIIEELQVLTKKMRELIVNINCLHDKIQNESCDLMKENVPRKLTSIRTSLIDAVKRLSKHQRTSATHIFVILISTESRSSKPYALPVQCLPIAALRDRQARDLGNSVIASMIERGMKVAGMSIK